MFGLSLLNNYPYELHMVRRNIENMDQRVEMLYILYLMVDMSQ